MRKAVISRVLTLLERARGDIEAASVEVTAQRDMPLRFDLEDITKQIDDITDGLTVPG
jgi:signal recognition particle GTPase